MKLKTPMKRIVQIQLLLFLFLCFFSPEIKAQENDSIVPIENPKRFLRKIDLSEFTHNGLKLWQDDFSGHWVGIDFGFNMLLDEDYSGYESEFMDNDVFRSNSAYFNFLQQSIGLQKNRNTIGLVTGLGLQLQSYRLDDNTTIIKGNDGVIAPDYLYFNDNQKSKLAIEMITLPLLLEFQIPINHYDNRMFISAGVVGSLRLSGHTKIKYKEEKKEKLKVVDDFSMHRFRYSAMVRTGYRWFNVFASYDLVPLFKTDKGPELTPFTFGITLMRL
ncbi:outer membrane beta-barrel protein [Draconibacterium sp. IB214405]|uniref:outer membrane beta-barrel protein n=1 Tax=Draconibacterium sp. IB214405 TaxID=3097352 RepID=UPI002A0C8963|nr:outer membrane beta-barrel protein [Draconibacterium sp. IB214405]MDX8341637.1 outer membrane beta-barrel protein [Draconibacterium sp. IB214405]